MRKIFGVLCVMCFMLGGCGKAECENTGLNTKIENTSSQKEDVSQESSLLTNDYPNVKMEIVVEKSDNKMMTVVITNDSENTTMFGAWFALEKYENGVWYEIPPKRVVEFNSLGYPIESKQTREFTVGYDIIYELEAFQKYRLIKNFSDEKGDVYYVSDEFEISITAD